jgi:dihydrofolate synthase/folylpolyglutamate synthase
VSDKHYEEMIRTMCEGHEFCSIIVTQVGGKRAVKAEEFAEIFRRYTDVPVRAVPDAAQAFDEALSSRPEGGMLFCAGSLYLVGEIKEHLQ